VTAAFTSNGRRAIAAKYSTALRVRGTVKTAKGAPIANATVVIRARNTAPGAKPGKLATTKTDSKGRYETTIARGPSRKVTVSYTAYSDDAEPADSATVSVSVKAAAKLVTNVRTVRVGQALKLRGRLVHPQAGVMVLICATDAGKWRSFDHVRTDRKGRFHYTYKFKRGSEGRSFGFSVLVDDRVYPFLAGYSNQVTVKVAR
jgi:5-hydroxyisourate hydrolase-like protein (transthyretin family)